MHFYLLGQIEPEKTGSMLEERYNRYRGVTIRVITGFYCIKVNSGLKSTILNLTKLTFSRAYPPPQTKYYCFTLNCHLNGHTG